MGDGKVHDAEQAHALGHETRLAIGKMWHREVESSRVDEVKVFFSLGVNERAEERPVLQAKLDDIGSTKSR